MKKCLLLLSLVLAATACHRNTIPSQEEIQREVPAGTLVRVVLRDRTDIYRFSSFLVDVSKDRVVEIRHGSTREELEALGQSTPGKGVMQLTSSGSAPSNETVTLFTECKGANQRPGCGTVALHNGDPWEVPDGPGDPTGHEELWRIRRLAALSIWSVKHAGMRIDVKPRALPPATHQR